MSRPLRFIKEREKFWQFYFWLKISSGQSINVIRSNQNFGQVTFWYKEILIFFSLLSNIEGRNLYKMCTNFLEKYVNTSRTLFRPVGTITGERITTTTWLVFHLLKMGDDRRDERRWTRRVLHGWDLCFGYDINSAKIRRHFWYTTRYVRRLQSCNRQIPFISLTRCKT